MDSIAILTAAAGGLNEMALLIQYTVPPAGH